MKIKIGGFFICILLIMTAIPATGIIKNDDITTSVNSDKIDLLKKETSGCGNSGNWVEQDKLTASDGSMGDYLGTSVSIDGEYAIVGAYGDDDNAFDAGSAYIFKRSGTNWYEQDKLIPSEGSDDDSFGLSVGISNDYAIIGCPEDDDLGYNSGSAFIYKRIGTSWYQEEKLTASDGTYDNFFGMSVSIDGDYAIVGAPYAHSSYYMSGAAYIFKNSGSYWYQQAILTYSDPGPYNYFGWSVSISGDYVLVASPLENNSTGVAYVFKRSGTNWSQQAKLTASDGSSGDYFSASVSVDGEYAVIGAFGDDYGESYDSGSAYVFKRIGTYWTQQAKLTASDPDLLDYFGSSVSISGDYSIIGSPEDDYGGSNSGSVYIFKRSGTSWSQQKKLIPSDAKNEKIFGISVSIDGYHALIGAYGDDDNGVDSGAAYVFNLEEPIPDIPILQLVNIRGGALGFSVGLKNFGEKTAYDISWEMIVLDGLLFPDSDGGEIPYLEPGEEERIKLKWKFGLGKSTIEFRCHYSISIGEAREEFDVSSKQEYNDLGFLIGHAFPEFMQPEKVWKDIQTFDYKEYIGGKGVLLKFEGINQWHNVRVVRGLDSGSSDEEFFGLCKFTDGEAFIEEGWITRSDIESALAHWEVELVDGE